MSRLHETSFLFLSICCSSFRRRSAIFLRENVIVGSSELCRLLIITSSCLFVAFPLNTSFLSYFVFLFSSTTVRSFCSYLALFLPWRKNTFRYSSSSCWSFSKILHSIVTHFVIINTSLKITKLHLLNSFITIIHFNNNYDFTILMHLPFNLLLFSSISFIFMFCSNSIDYVFIEVLFSFIPWFCSAAAHWAFKLKRNM